MKPWTTVATLTAHGFSVVMHIGKDNVRRALQVTVQRTGLRLTILRAILRVETSAIDLQGTQIREINL